MYVAAASSIFACSMGNFASALVVPAAKFFVPSSTFRCSSTAVLFVGSAATGLYW